MIITLTPRKVVLAVAAVVAVLAAYLVGSTRPASATAPAAQATSNADGVTVTGSGTVTGTPDTLRLSLRVSAQGADVSDALAGADATATRVQASLSTAGVELKDLQTSGLSVQPSYGRNGQVTGYTADESLTVVLRSLATAGATITKAVTAGGNRVRVDGLSVGLDSTSALAAGARTRAVDDAKAKATQYAEAAGRTLGPVISISETVQQPGFASYDRAALQSASSSIQPGSEDVVVTVTIVYGFA